VWTCYQRRRATFARIAEVRLDGDEVGYAMNPGAPWMPVRRWPD
jgi:hypothetical protein